MSHTPTFSPQSRPAPHWSSFLIGPLFGLMLVGMGALFVWWLWASYQKASATSKWLPTPCTIVESRLTEYIPAAKAAVEWRFEAVYRYQVDGLTHLGQKVRRLAPQSVHQSRMEALRTRFPVGSQATCFVNPQDPSKAVLMLESRAALYAIWFPALFIVGGLGIVANAFRQLILSRR